MVYDEQEYTCQRGDTWAEISKNIYHSDRYAEALQRHNQNHPRAGEQMMRTGQLAEGQRIFIPQAYVLEQKYADALRTAPTPASAPTMMQAGFVEKGGAPPPGPPASVPPLQYRKP